MSAVITLVEVNSGGGGGGGRRMITIFRIALSPNDLTKPPTHVSSVQYQMIMEAQLQKHTLHVHSSTMFLVVKGQIT